ncbi:uncharacterized protein LOC114320188 [Camellia sinensis]|uniref:uncharacterized protein LOC114320188 n=1 Tax=Camellia sinensis TaxID=4442 RepID=UPI001036C7EB|nr:uncharacterized protein LOC114320188 [Camellia sinensis]
MWVDEDKEIGLVVFVGKKNNKEKKGLFPVAFAVVDAENASNWEWFLRQLVKVVDGSKTLTGRRYSDMCSNATESFNNCVQKARHRPITQLVDGIKGQIMEQRSKRKVKSSVWVGELCLKMAKVLESAYNDSRSWIIRQFKDNVFEVRSHLSVLVDFRACTCSCFQWQLSRFPCSYAAVAFQNSSKNIYDFIDSFYYVHEFRAAYSGANHPIPTIRKPNLATMDYLIAPPIFKRPPRRSKQKWVLSKGEVVQRIQYGRCGKMGHHNRKTCEEPM